jgi:nucleoside-diphosphate-sugar epimerase
VAKAGEGIVIPQDQHPLGGRLIKDALSRGRGGLLVAVRAGAPGAVEADRAPAPTLHYPRATGAAAEEVRAQGVDVSVMRLPPSVHGAGDPNFIPTLIQTARRTGRSAYIGEGLNRWSAVHRLDAARLFRLALEAEAPLQVYHAAGEEGIPFRDIAAAIGRGLDLPVEPVAPGEARAQFGWFESFAAMDTAASSAVTQAHLRWSRSEPGLLQDIADGHYFGRAEDAA